MSCEFWTEKCNYFKTDPTITLNNPFIGYLLSNNISMLQGLTIHQQSHYESFLHAYCLFKQGDLANAASILTDIIQHIPTNQKPFLSAIHFYLGLCTNNTKLYLIQSFELWMGNYDALYYLLQHHLIPSQEKNNLAHIISQIDNEIIKDLYWCQLASNGPVLLDCLYSNMLDDDSNTNIDSDSMYIPSASTTTPEASITNTTSDVPITLNEVQHIVNEMQHTLNTRCIQLHLKQFDLLKNNIDILLFEGIRHYHFYCFKNCLHYMVKVLQHSPTHKMAQLYYLQSALYMQDVDLLYKASTQLKHGNTIIINKDVASNDMQQTLFKVKPPPIVQHQTTSESTTENDMLWFAQGCFNLLTREFDKAIAAYTRCLEINPQLSQAHLHLGLLYSFLAQFDTSIYEFSCYKQQCVESYIPYLLIGSRYLLQKKIKIAESFLLEALQRAVPEKLPMRKMVHKLASIQIPQGQQQSALFHSTIIPIQQDNMQPQQPLEADVLSQNDNAMDDIMNTITPKTFVDPNLLLSLAYLYKLSGKYEISNCYFENILRQLITRPSIGYVEMEVESVGLIYNNNKWELTGTLMSTVVVQYIQFTFLNLADIYIAQQEYELAQYYLSNIHVLDEEYAINNGECLPLAFHILSFDCKDNNSFREFVIGNGLKLMGKCWACLGDYIKAIGCYEEAFEKIPNDKVIHGLYDDALSKLKENPPLDKEK